MSLFVALPREPATERIGCATRTRDRLDDGKNGFERAEEQEHLDGKNDVIEAEALP